MGIKTSHTAPVACECCGEPLRACSCLGPSREDMGNEELPIKNIQEITLSLNEDEVGIIRDRLEIIYNDIGKRLNSGNTENNGTWFDLQKKIGVALGYKYA